MSTEPDSTRPDLSRRGVIRGVAVGGLAIPFLNACGGDETTAPPAGNESASASDPSSPAASGSASGDATAGVTVPQADVPVGGGTILEDDLIVVTQPAEGEFKAFTAVCTHQKCPVGEIADRQIICPCHQSHYSIEDGSVVSGPAPASLKEFPVTLKGDDVVIG